MEALREPDVDGPATPLALAGWLPAWDIERRVANLEEVVLWTLAQQRKIVAASGVPGPDHYKKVVLAKGEKQFCSKLHPKPR